MWKTRDRPGPLELRDASAPYEHQVTIGISLELVRRIVGAVMVERAQQDAIGEIGLAAQRPAFEVMGFAPDRRNGAAASPASSIADSHRLALCAIEEPHGATEIEDLRPPAEDDG